jgi:glycosyltransferase involved in cell wall biosynthesis
MARPAVPSFLLRLGRRDHIPEATGQRVSVVMATLNGAKFVGDQLDSLAAQTVRPLELVVGDDGSSDGTAEIVSKFAESAPFPVILTRNSERLGASDNFLALSAQARGPLIAFCDQDDVWDRRKLERITPWFREPATSLVLHRALVVDEALRPLGRRWPPIRRTRVRPALHVDLWFPAFGMAMVFRKSLLNVVAGRARPPSRDLDGHPIDHDEWVYLLSASLGRTVFLAEDLTKYRQHGSAFSGAPAPRGGLRESFDRRLRFGTSDFRRRAGLLRAHRDFWLTLTTDPDAGLWLRDAATKSAALYGRLASDEDARVLVHDEAIGNRRRAFRLLRLVLAGRYRPRAMAGLGTRALAGDTLRLLRNGSGSGSVAAPAELANRVAAERAAGRTAEAIAARLSQEGVPPLRGTRWSAEMIRDVVYQAHRAAESGAVAAGSAAGRAPANSTPDADRKPPSSTP